MSLEPGQTLSHYRLLEKLGEGGMGVVWKALDTKLDREIAIKTLPEKLASDPERLARFEREAKLLAALDHPNIAAIHGLEESEGLQFLVMELVPGEDLGQRLARGPMSVKEALTVCCQIAEALEAAHEKGIIHRDLKPGNLKITPDGKIKVLDFGLAKALLPEPSAADPALSPTVTSGGTQAGVILGTAAYMSPEQARGKAVDRRSDIWAVGCVLYEMLTGKKVFVGETVTDTLAKILEVDPDWRALPSGTPRRIREVLRKCLHKDAKDRLHDVADARIEFREALDEPDEEVGIAETSVFAPKIVWLSLGLIAVLALGALAGYRIRSWWPENDAVQATTRARAGTLTEIQLPPEAPLTLDARVALVGWEIPGLALSPDGSRLVYVGLSGETTQLYLRDMNHLEVTPIPGTEGAIYPFFSPDGRWVGYLTNSKVKKTSLQGGTPITLCEARAAMTASWTRDDLVYFTELEGATLTRVSARGGAPTEVVSRGVSRRFGQVLPDGKWVLLSSVSTGISRDYSEIQVLSLENFETKTLLSLGYDPRYLPSGHLIFARGGSLFAVEFDAERLQVRGEAVAIASGVRMNSFVGLAQFAPSANGLVVYAPGGDLSAGRPAWVDRRGDTQFLDVEERVYGPLDLAPDGKRLAVHVADVRDYVWLYDLERGEGRRLKTDGSDGWPKWSRSGNEVAFSSSRKGEESRIFVQSLDGRAATRELLRGRNTLRAGSWSPGDNAIAVTEFTLGYPTRFISVTGEQRLGWDPGGAMPEFSPDGEWVAYCSAEEGQYEVFVRSYPDGQTVHQISTDYGAEPRWCRECDDLFYRRGNQWMAVSFRFDPELDWDTPRLVFETEFIDTPGRSFDVSPDGQRLLVVKGSHETDPTRLQVLTNALHQFDQLASARDN